MLRKQATIEAFIEWLDGNIEQKIIKVKYTEQSKLFRFWWFGFSVGVIVS